jgi:hypothetical protein
MNVRMATSPRDQSPGTTTSHPGSMAASTASSLPMYMSSSNYPGVVSSNTNRPLMPSPAMYSTPAGTVQSSAGYSLNQPSIPSMPGMQYGGQRMPLNTSMPNRPPIPNYPQSFSGPPGQPPAYSTQRFPEASAYPPGFMSSPGSQHPPSSN